MRFKIESSNLPDALRPDALTLATFFSTITLGQTLLSASLLGLRVSHRQVYLPLAVCFLAMSISGMSAIVDAPLFQTLPRSIPHLMTGASFPADVLILPMFWFYVRNMTAERAELWNRRDLVHFIPAIVGLIILIMLVFTPETDRVALFDSGRDQNSLLQAILFFLIVGLYIAWLCQWLFYALAILKRLVAYKARLKELFASTEHLELGWIGWIGVLILVDWLWVAVVFLIEAFTDITPFEEPWLSLLDMALVWTLSIWGLRQAPGLAVEANAVEQIEQAGQKYQKSALGEEQITRLADKIEAAMRDEHLYRNPDLSLSVLASHISARPNYVSQTLNAKLGASFFDYVNEWRVKDAQARLNTSTNTVLEIAFAVGFNTRSSFYTAFKRYAGTTPTAWRKTHTTD